jgi:hypothetical protein
MIKKIAGSILMTCVFSTYVYSSDSFYNEENNYHKLSMSTTQENRLRSNISALSKVVQIIQNDLNMSIEPQSEIEKPNSSSVSMNYYILDESEQDPKKRLEVVTFSDPNRAVYDGPKDKWLQVSITDVTTKSGNVSLAYKEGSIDFDSCSVYATVRLTQEMWGGTLDRLLVENPKNFTFANAKKNWDTQGTIKINPMAMNEMNAYYSRSLPNENRVLNFGYFTSLVHRNKIVNTCRALDVTAHEAGHACLDTFKPYYFETDALQTGGFHESFGDITAEYFLWNNQRIVKILLAQTRGDLSSRSNFLSSLGEYFGAEIGMSQLRDAQENITLSRAGDEVHDVSRVYTSAQYDSLVKGIEQAKKMGLKIDEAQICMDVANYQQKLLLGGILCNTESSPDFQSISSSVVSFWEMDYKNAAVKAYARNIDWKTIMVNEFAKNEVYIGGKITSQQKLKSTDHKQSHICTSMIPLKEKEIIVCEPDEKGRLSLVRKNKDSTEDVVTQRKAKNNPYAFLQIIKKERSSSLFESNLRF